MAVQETFYFVFRLEQLSLKQNSYILLCLLYDYHISDPLSLWPKNTSKDQVRSLRENKVGCIDSRYSNVTVKSQKNLKVQDLNLFDK